MSTRIAKKQYKAVDNTTRGSRTARGVGTLALLGAMIAVVAGFPAAAADAGLSSGAVSKTLVGVIIIFVVGTMMIKAGSFGANAGEPHEPTAHRRPTR